MIQCEYVADTNDETSYGHTDDEVIEDGVVACTAEAKRVIRPAGFDDTISGIARPGRSKRAVCEAHAEYLVAAPAKDRPNDRREWEFDAAEPKIIVEQIE